MPYEDMNAIHPGEVLREVYLKPPCPLTVAGLAQAIELPEQDVSDLINGHRAITRGIATRLAVLCRTTPEFWLALQRTYDRRVQRGKHISMRRPQYDRTDAA